jgi:hypothetical protein
MANKKEKQPLVITKDICDKVLYIDCRTPEGAYKLSKALKKLPMIKSEEDLQTDMLEKYIKKIEKKYMIHLAYVMRSIVDCEDHYSFMIKHYITHSWLKTIYAETMWEGHAKTLFFMYFYIEDERRKMRNRKG